MGEVYSARDASLGREVAIKVLPDAFAVDPERLARFEREARVLATLNHPHIAHIYGLERSPSPFIVMELVAGDTLDARLNRLRQGFGAREARVPSATNGERGRAVPLDEALAIARQIADALDAAHERGIVHRDLKPANIALTEHGAVKLLDFGLAKSSAIAAGGDDLTHSPTVMAATVAGVLLGTAPYMSPEQARGKAVDKRTDIWAFGCVLYEMLTGRRAFGGDTMSDAIAAILERDPDWTALPSQTPAPVRELLERCLQKDAKLRLRDIADALHDLKMDRTGGGPIRASAVKGARAWIWPLTLGALGGVVVAGLAGAAFIGRPVAEAPTFSRIVRLTSGPAREVAPVVSPDGKWVAYLSDAGGSGNVWIKFIAGGEAINLTGSSGLDIGLGTGIGGLDVAPDGSRIAVAARPRGGDGAFSTWEVPAPLPGIARRVLDAGAGNGMRWSPDGTHIVFIRPGSASGDALFVADADGSNARQLIPPQNGMHIHWPAWSRDGFIYFLRTFTTVANLDPAEIYRIDSRGGGTMEPFVETPRRAMEPFPSPDGRGLFYAANPTTAERRLWWRAARDAPARELSFGVGEYVEPHVSADGNTLVCTIYELRQSLVRINVDGKPAVQTPLTDGFQGDLDPALSPNGDRLAFTSSRSGSRLIWTARDDGSDPRPLTGGNANDERPAFSPDGRQIAFISDRSGRRATWVVPADGGQPRKIADADTATGGLTWSRDGTRIVYGAGAGAGPGLWSVPAAGGSPERIPTSTFASEPAWSPTGDVIAYMSITREGPSVTNVSFLDASGRPTILSQATPPGANGFSNGMVAWAPDGRRLAVANQQANATASIWIMDPQSPVPYVKLIDLGIGPRIRGFSWTRDGKALIVGKHDWTSDIVLMDHGK
jgi:Tol biopolymer transport system component